MVTMGIMIIILTDILIIKSTQTIVDMMIAEKEKKNGDEEMSDIPPCVTLRLHFI